MQTEIKTLSPILMQSPTAESTRSQILIVDDDASVRDGLKLVLEMKNFTVVTAADGEEALVLLERAVPSLIVVDCQLPGMRGSEAVRLIRVEHSQLPILGISAHVELEEEMLGAGATIFLPKPIEMNALVSEIRELTGGARVDP